MLYYIRQTDDINVKESMCFYVHECVFGCNIMRFIRCTFSKELSYLVRSFVTKTRWMNFMLQQDFSAYLGNHLFLTN